MSDRPGRGQTASTVAHMTQGHRITITPTDLHVEVAVNGEKIAESDRPVLLEETGLPTRYYLPRDDVRDGPFVWGRARKLACSRL